MTPDLQITPEAQAAATDLLRTYGSSALSGGQSALARARRRAELAEKELRQVEGEARAAEAEVMHLESVLEALLLELARRRSHGDRISAGIRAAGPNWPHHAASPADAPTLGC
jgi:hypothetical protein